MQRRAKFVLSRKTMGVMERMSPHAAEFAAITPFSLRQSRKIGIMELKSWREVVPRRDSRNGY